MPMHLSPMPIFTLGISWFIKKAELHLPTKKPPKRGGLIFPVVILNFMVPIWDGISTFWIRLLGDHRASSLTPLCMTIYSLNYNIINSEINIIIL
jgi:hypothetical protein